MDAKTLCLGVLQMGGASGYEIRKAFTEGVFSYIHETSYGSIYPALNQLVRDGLAVCTTTPQEKRPDKKVYTITPKGRQALKAALQAPPGRDKLRSDFLFIMIFGDLLPPEQLLALVDERIAWYGEVLQHLGCACAEQQPVGPQLVNGMGRAVYAAARDYLRANRDRVAAAALDDDASARVSAR